MESEEDDPLDQIFVDGNAMDRQLLAELLEPYLVIDKEDGRLYTKESYGELQSKDKILVALAARRAMADRDIVESSSLGPAELSDLSRVPEGTVKPAVRDLDEEDLIDNGDDGYHVQGPQIQRIVEYIKQDDQ